MTVKELLVKLNQLSPEQMNLEVKVWMPDTWIKLSRIFEFRGTICIEGNLEWSRSQSRKVSK